LPIYSSAAQCQQTAVSPSNYVQAASGGANALLFNPGGGGLLRLPAAAGLPPSAQQAFYPNVGLHQNPALLAAAAAAIANQQQQQQRYLLQQQQNAALIMQQQQQRQFAQFTPQQQLAMASYAPSAGGKRSFDQAFALASAAAASSSPGVKRSYTDAAHTISADPTTYAAAAAPSSGSN
jgi:hypothetical protein